MTHKQTYSPGIHHRKSIRLKGYDYAKAGAYFITICVQNRECLFGEIADGEMQLNDAGTIAANCWDEIPKHFPNVILDQCIIMPNHVHGIIVITKSVPICVPGEKNVGANIVGANNYSPLRTSQPQRKNGTSKTIGSIVRGFKIGVTKWFRANQSSDDSPQTVWQRNYYEHIIRDDDDLSRIREYIATNSMNWMTDENNPDKKP